MSLTMGLQTLVRSLRSVHLCMTVLLFPQLDTTGTCFAAHSNAATIQTGFHT